MSNTDTDTVRRAHQEWLWCSPRKRVEGEAMDALYATVSALQHGEAPVELREWEQPSWVGKFVPNAPLTLYGYSYGSPVTGWVGGLDPDTATVLQGSPPPWERFLGRTAFNVEVDSSTGTENLYPAVETVDSDVVVFLSEGVGRLEVLAREFGVDLRFLESVRKIIAGYVGVRPHLSLDVDRMVDPELGRAVEIVFEISGTQSPEETTRVWEEVGTALESALSESERETLYDLVGVHVHRGTP